jgi:allophanate hydrolase subunit 2
MPMRLAAGEAFAVEPSHNVRVRYLAVGGGLDVPMQLDGRGTLLTASLGVFGGRALRSGDRLSILTSRTHEARPLTPLTFDANAPIRIVAGPDLERFAPDALNVLLHNTFTVSTASDRVGTRLDGPPLPRIDRDDAGSRPMVRGVIEVPSGGSPIVLGPDHPTTGGYPVLAVVIRADQGAFAARRASAPVRFRAVDVDEARAAWRVAADEWFARSER